MSKIMAVNAGSSSLKFQLLEMPKEEVITEGLLEKIGLKDPHFTIKYNGLKEEEDVTIQNHQDAVEMLLKVLIEKKIVNQLEEISGVLPLPLPARLPVCSCSNFTISPVRALTLQSYLRPLAENSSS